jgi:DinB family protein
VSLALLAALHERWVLVLKALGDDDLDRPYVHPEMGDMPLRAMLGMYAWHGRHHVAHVTALRQRQGW